MGDQGVNGEGEGLSPAKKSYSLEDITAALDDMIEGNEYLKENASFVGTAQSHEASATHTDPPQVATADEELDALSLALKAFPPKPKPKPGQVVEEK